MASKAEPLYNQIGESYRNFRVPDKRIAQLIQEALVDAKTIVNVGAGTGSYEPEGYDLIAVEPSETMILQRPKSAAAVVKASAENLPFKDNQFDAGMAILTIHHWNDWKKGLLELNRVANKCIILTWNPSHKGFWLTKDYFPEILEIDKRIFPPFDQIQKLLSDLDVITVPIPHDCTDGFGSAFWRQPSKYLDLGVRKAMSTFSKINNLKEGIERLKVDLENGAWQEKYGHLMQKQEMDLGYRLLITA